MQNESEKVPDSKKEENMDNNILTPPEEKQPDKPVVTPTPSGKPQPTPVAQQFETLVRSIVAVENAYTETSKNFDSSKYKDTNIGPKYRSEDGSWWWHKWQADERNIEYNSDPKPPYRKIPIEEQAWDKYVMNTIQDEL